MSSLFIVLLALTVTVVGSSDVLQYTLTEELPAGHVLGNVLTDSSLSSRLTADELSQLTFSVLPSGGTWNSVVVVETRTGVIRTAEQLDREELCRGMEQCVFEVDIATGPAEFFSIISVRLHIEDINDNAAAFLDELVERSISESASPGTVVPLPPAYDDDLGTNSITRYTPTEQSDM